MHDLDLVKLDREVQEAVGAHRRWRQAVRSGDASVLGTNPLDAHRGVSSRNTRATVQQLPQTSSLANALLPWIGSLTIDRVTLEDWVAVESTRRSAVHLVSEFGNRPLAVRFLVLRTVTDPDADCRRAAAHALVDRSDDVASNALFWLARRHEAARQLGLETLALLEAPAETGSDIQKLLSVVLDETDDVARELVGITAAWHESLACGCAHDATEGWPANLGIRWLHDTVHSMGPLATFRPDIGVLPEALCGASFARALSCLGTALFRGIIASQRRAFCIGNRPFDARAFAFGALFASLLASETFYRRRFCLGTDAAHRHARAFARTLVIATRLTAVQAAVGACATLESAQQAHAVLGSRALLTSLPPELVGVLPRVRPTACSRLMGALRAAQMHDTLVNEYDTDWFDNPRAHRLLSEIDPTERFAMDEPSVREGARALVGMANRVLL